MTEIRSIEKIIAKQKSPRSVGSESFSLVGCILGRFSIFFLRGDLVTWRYGGTCSEIERQVERGAGTFGSYK